MVLPRVASFLCAPLGLALLAIPLAASACRDRESTPTIVEDASVGRRVFKAPTGEVRALPPHNIHRNGVGPYELHAGFQKTLALLPSGPRVELFKAEGLFDYRLMRADNDTLVLGVGRHNLLDFISVLDPDIARTESGVGVGAGLEELVGALGAVRQPKDSGRDPRIVTFSSLPDTRFIVENKKVVAAVVMPSRSDPKPTPTLPPVIVPAAVNPGGDSTVAAAETGCQADELLELRGQLLEIANVRSRKASVVTGCLLGDLGEAIIQSGNTLKLISTEAGSGPKLWGAVDVPGLRFAAIVATGTARPDLYTVSQREDLQMRQVEVTRYRLAGGRISPAWTRVAFGLEATTASWIGAKITAADFLVELQGTDGALIVGGLYVQREGDELKMVVPLDPLEMPVALGPRKDEGTPGNDMAPIDGGGPQDPAKDIAP